MSNLKVAILIPPEEAEAPADRHDTFVQAQQIHQCLSRLGHEVLTIVFGADRKQTADELLRTPVDCVVNLVEDLPEGPDQQYRVTECLDRLGIPYTGARTAALRSLGDKRRTKQLLREAGLPTPGEMSMNPSFRPPHCGEGGASTPGGGGSTHRSCGSPFDPFGATLPEGARENGETVYIVKSAIEHASIGLDRNSVVTGSQAARALLRDKQARGGVWFAEEYIDGREFNVAMLETGGGPLVLPVAEILFLDHAGRPKIVGYAEKWDAHSAAFAATPRIFPTEPGDASLLADLRRLALAAWRLFGLAGYARVDFRVDAAGAPYILEVNANPCLAADAGFCAAAGEAGLTQTDVVAHLIETALAHPASLAPDRRAGRP